MTATGSWRIGLCLRRRCGPWRASHVAAGVSAWLARHASDPAAVRATLVLCARFVNVRNARVGSFAAENPACAPAVLSRLCDRSFHDTFDPVDRVAEGGARNPAAGPEVLRSGAVSADTARRCATAQNAACDAETLQRLACDDDAEVVAAVALNPSSPAALIEQVVATGDPRAASGAAMNPSCPPALLRRLAAGADPVLRQAACEAMASRGMR